MNNPEQVNDDGGPARYATMRDIFAISALQGILANPGLEKLESIYQFNNVSRKAYEHADAMLATRKSSDAKEGKDV